MGEGKRWRSVFLSNTDLFILELHCTRVLSLVLKAFLTNITSLSTR